MLILNTDRGSYVSWHTATVIILITAIILGLYALYALAINFYFDIFSSTGTNSGQNILAPEKTLSPSPFNRPHLF